MKNFVLLLPLLCILGLASCGEDRSAEMRTLLVGEWKHNYDMGNGVRVKGTAHYRADQTVSTFSQKYHKGELEETVKAEGTWSIEDEYLTVETVAEGSVTKNRQRVPLIEVNNKVYRYELEGVGELFETRVEGEKAKE